jgi:hypothetical protein
VKLKKRRRRRKEGRRGCRGFFSDSRIFLSSIFEEAFQAPPEEENYSKLHFQIRSKFSSPYNFPSNPNASLLACLLATVTGFTPM